MNSENLAQKLAMTQKTFHSPDGGMLNYCLRKTGNPADPGKAALMMFLHGGGAGRGQLPPACALRRGSCGFLRVGTDQGGPSLPAVSGGADVDSGVMVAAGTCNE